MAQIKNYLHLEVAATFMVAIFDAGIKPAATYTRYLFFISYLFIPSFAIAFCYEEAGSEYDINPKLLKIIALTESNLKTDALNINKDGTSDLGLMQINSSWVNALNLDAKQLLSNPCYNTMTGAKILKQCIDRYGYTWEAVGCYNATNRYKRVEYSWKIFKRLKAEDRSLSPQSLGGGGQKAEGKEQNSELKTHAVGWALPTNSNEQNSELHFSVREITP